MHLYRLASRQMRPRYLEANLIMSIYHVFGSIQIGRRRTKFVIVQVLFSCDLDTNCLLLCQYHITQLSAKFHVSRSLRFDCFQSNEIHKNYLLTCLQHKRPFLKVVPTKGLCVNGSLRKSVVKDRRTDDKQSDPIMDPFFPFRLQNFKYIPTLD